MRDDELVRGAILCLSSTIIASGGERNRRNIPLTLLLNYAPYSLYTKWADEFVIDTTKDASTNDGDYDSTQLGIPLDSTGIDNFDDSFFLADEDMPLGVEGENLLNFVSEAIVLGTKTAERKQDLDDWWSDDETGDQLVKKTGSESSPPPILNYSISDPITSENVLEMSQRKFLFTFFVHNAKKAEKDAGISPIEILRLYMEGKTKDNTAQHATHHLWSRMVWRILYSLFQRIISDLFSN